MAARSPNLNANPQCSGEFTEYTGNSNPVTIAAWFRSSNGYGSYSNGIYPIFAINNQLASAGSRILLAVSGGFSKVFTFDVLSSPSLTGNSISSLGGNKWTHLCGVVTSSTDRKFYENGIEVGSTITSATINSTVMCSILSLYQQNAWSTNVFSTSEIADIGVWNINLTSGEVYSLSRGFTCNKIRPQSLVLYMPMMSGQYLQDIMKNRAFVSGNFTNTDGSVLPSAPALY